MVIGLKKKKSCLLQSREISVAASCQRQGVRHVKEQLPHYLYLTATATGRFHFNIFKDTNVLDALFTSTWGHVHGFKLVPSAWNNKGIIVAPKSFLKSLEIGFRNSVAVAEIGQMDGWLFFFFDNVMRFWIVQLLQCCLSGVSDARRPSQTLPVFVTLPTFWWALPHLQHSICFRHNIHGQTTQWHVSWVQGCTTYIKLLFSSLGRRIMFPSRRSLYQCESKCQLCTIGTFPSLFARSFCFIYSRYCHFNFLSYLFIFFCRSSVSSRPGLWKTCTPHQQPVL